MTRRRLHYETFEVNPEIDPESFAAGYSEALAECGPLSGITGVFSRGRKRKQLEQRKRQQEADRIEAARAAVGVERNPALSSFEDGYAHGYLEGIADSGGKVSKPEKAKRKRKATAATKAKAHAAKSKILNDAQKKAIRNFRDLSQPLLRR